MARGYGADKRRRELDKKKKRDEKRDRIRSRRTSPDGQEIVDGDPDATPSDADAADPDATGDTEDPGESEGGSESGPDDATP